MTKEEMKNKYSAFITEISEILGLGKPVDILKLCATTDLFFQPLENRITELEKACDETQELLDKQIEATYKLDKENAELKKKYVKNITDCDICDTYCNSQLTKAKEIIRDFISVAIDYIDKEDKNYSYIVEAEQFLNSEVEK